MKGAEKIITDWLCANLTLFLRVFSSMPLDEVMAVDYVRALDCMCATCGEPERWCTK
jgi:hypothetical protein